jgi:hypothetical protein
MYLIAGLPHSGTRFMVSVLKHLGSKAEHERRNLLATDIDGRVSGLHFRREIFEEFSPIIHLVRHPLAWVHTHARRNGLKWHKDQYSTRDYEPLGNYIRKDNIDPKKYTEIKFLMVWLRANEYIEHAMNPVMRIRVEDTHNNTKIIKQLCDVLEIPRVKDFELFCKVTEGSGDREPWLRGFYWPNTDKYQDELELVKQKAKEYGYEN